ncbi:hypothetical protein VP1G_05024 [Cytospora mali]|uniref:Uncharacterized protein n=1 Tax=Cytospora mali TaxID=578113 RepID=A0A194V1A8_CYTMA|nr:hypothetical protein VP1G_05024 [Valsa mali var. pyri (nom. inval.)]
MDAAGAYNQHSSQSRRKNRSSTNLNRLSLAPLTTKLPINDHENDMFFPDLAAQTYSTSYIQGKSAPATPSLLSRSPARATSKNRLQSRPGSAAPLPKSKSAVHLERDPTPRSGATTPGGHRRGSKKEEPGSARGRTDSDWLLRAGVLISSETRESKGQSWLVSRASSTSLTGMRNAADEDDEHEPDMFERERLARENALVSKHASHRNSQVYMEGDDSPFISHRGSLYASRTASRSQLGTPGERTAVEGYFAPQDSGLEDLVPGPDFVNLDETLEATGIEQDTSQDDEADVRRLVKSGIARPSTWFGNVLGWALFSVEENDEDDEADVEGSDGEGEAFVPDTPPERQFEGVTALPEQRMPPPKVDEGGWQDAAWLLSVASKVAWS